MHQKFILLLILFSLSPFITSSRAIGGPSLDEFSEELKWPREERIVYTATKTPERLSKSGNSVTVITARKYVIWARGLWSIF